MKTDWEEKKDMFQFVKPLVFLEMLFFKSPLVFPFEF